METKDTPGKWVSRNETIWNSDMTTPIAVVNNYDYEGREHIRRIVTAVNSHNELVEACKYALSYLKGIDAGEQVCQELEQALKNASL